MKGPKESEKLECSALARDFLKSRISTIPGEGSFRGVGCKGGGAFERSSRQQGGGVTDNKETEATRKKPKVVRGVKSSTR